jgi:antibiotic biosynthesis monooxygenase (ABM) superfamily enzyme
MSKSEEHDVRRSLTPPRYKVAAITWLAIYPALTTTLALLGPVLAPLPLFLRTLVLTAILVPIMVYLLVPGLQRIFADWLRPPGPPGS